tara:strand:- start:105 stop:572 length:468 start_codon:yes stop_codon:yes gene_type:complete
MNLNNKILYKKIYKETPEIMNNYGNYSMQYIREQKYIKLKVNYKNLLIEINFIGFFPFQKPDVLINNKYYNNILIFNDQFFINHLKKLNINCLCCESILCTNNWSPMFGIINILDEIKKNHTLINNIIKLKYLDKICKMHGIFCEELVEKIKFYL